MQITAATLAAIAGRPVNDNMRSTIAGLERAGVGAGLNCPHRLTQFLGQIAHETMGWHYDREVWNVDKPTAAQARYDVRTDLGNTPERDGEGFLYRGRGPIQLTGRANYAAFTEWGQAIDPAAPDFVRKPDAINTDPWEGLVPIWYWDSHSLNRYADNGDLLTITKRINGRTNGLADRQAQYTRAGLVLLGYAPADVRAFQRSHGLTVDGKAGPATRAAIHDELVKRPLVAFGEARPVPKPVINPPPARGSGSAVPLVLVVGAAIAMIGALKLFGG